MEKSVILGVGMTDYFEKQDIMAVSLASKLCVNFYILLHLNLQKKVKAVGGGGNFGANVRIVNYKLYFCK